MMSERDRIRRDLDLFKHKLNEGTRWRGTERRKKAWRRWLRRIYDFHMRWPD